MQQSPQKNVDKPVAGRRRAAAEARKTSQQKKLAAIVVLFFVMTVLWLRFFIIKDGPEAASAVSDVNLPAADAGQLVQEAVYIDLPVIAGRQDVLANDLFADRNFKGFRKIGETTDNSELDTADTNGLSGDLAAAAAQMELIAIVKDKKPQAFIEDNLLEIGQSFKFVFHGQIYNFKVVNILEDRVELECNGAVVTKKIPESLFTAE